VGVLNRYCLLLLLCGVALLGCGVIFLVTPWGIGLAPDSLVYVGAARSVIRGDGVVYLNDIGQFVPVTHYPPLYSVMLGGAGWFWGEPLAAARWLGAVFFAGNIALIGLMVCAATRSAGAVMFVSLVMLSSFPMLQIHSMAWTEPPSMFFGFLGLLGLVKYLAGGGRWILYGSALSIALSCLARYAGIPFLLTGAVALWIFAEQKWQKKFADAGNFLLLGSLPLIVWLARNWWIGGSPVNRSLAFHPLDLPQWNQALETIGLWLFPSQLVAQAPWLNVLALGIGVFCFWGLVQVGEFSKSRCQQISALYFLIYTTFVFTARLFVDPAIEFETRILSPAYVSLLILAVSAATLWIRRTRTKTKSWKWFGFDSLVIALTVLQMTNGVAWSLYSYTDGIGYNGKQWRESELVRYVQTLDPTVPIFTNAPDVLYLLTGKTTHMIPRKVSPESRRPNEAFATELAHLKKQLEERNGVLIYFSAESRLWFLPSEIELERELPLRATMTTPDGTLYRTKNLTREAER